MLCYGLAKSLPRTRWLAPKMRLMFGGLSGVLDFHAAGKVGSLYLTAWLRRRHQGICNQCCVLGTSSILWTPFRSCNETCGGGRLRMPA